MSEKDINRWQATITPRDTSKPWTLGSGGSFDMQDVKPIPDEMLVELARCENYMGAPWNCRSLPLSVSDREYMYLLYFSSKGLVARMRLAEKEAAEAKATWPLDIKPVRLQVAHYEGGTTFICGASGHVTVEMLSEINGYFDTEDPAAYFPDGNGDYLFEVTRSPAEHEGGMLIHRSHFELHQVGFRAHETDPFASHGKTP